MVIKRVSVISCARMVGAIYGIIGLILGVFVATFTLLGSPFGGEFSLSGYSWLGALFGVGGVVFFPIAYGVIGFIAGLSVIDW